MSLFFQDQLQEKETDQERQNVAKAPTEILKSNRAQKLQWFQV